MTGAESSISTSEGATVGAAVGSSVGAAVGDCVTKEAQPVSSDHCTTTPREREGGQLTAVGSSVGAAVGSAVGDRVGDSVGACGSNPDVK
jgi:phage tail tape-measure protein